MKFNFFNDINQIRKSEFLSIYYAFATLFIIMCVGVFGFMYIENYTFAEAFFMTVITMSTVGYEEVHTLGIPGMYFTSFLIIFSFGIFAYVITRLTRYIIDGEFKNRYKEFRVRKQIDNISNHVIICGFGRNGKQAAKDLVEHGEKVIVIDSIFEENEIHDEVEGVIFIKGDATREEFLLSAKVNTAKALITTLPSDANNLFVVLTAREFNEKMTIISRASEDHSDSKLKRAGATNVIMPDKVGGLQMAKLVSQPDIIEFIETIMLKSNGEVYLAEISCDKLESEMKSKTIRELDIRKISGTNLIGLKNSEGLYTYNPSPDIIINPSDKLFVLGTEEQVKKLKQVLSNND